MPFFVFKAKLAQIPPGVIPMFVVCGETIQKAYEIAKAHRMGTDGVPYGPTQAHDRGTYIVGNCWPPSPQVSPAGVQGGQPTGMPVAHPNAPSGPRAPTFGFEKLGGDAVPRSQDNMYGDFDDGSFTDLYNAGSGASQEVPRPQITGDEM